MTIFLGILVWAVADQVAKSPNWKHQIPLLLIFLSCLAGMMMTLHPEWIHE